MLLNDNIQLVTLLGKAGTGKTLLALAVSLHKVLSEKGSGSYRKLNVYRPIVPMGKDIGFLPGREEDKIHPYMQPIFDNLEFLLHDEMYKDGKKSEGSGLTTKYLQDTKQLEVKALTFIRGRSLPYQIILVDEAQNLTPHEAKTIITRAGEGTKIILTGDIYQIDHPYLDSTSNGLAYIVERFKYQKLAGHITLTKGERSDLAELAAEILD
jgi:PhoH-like ATPase